MKTFKKSLSVILACIMIFAFSAVAFAADGTITVKLRIEGISKCFYYSDVEVKDGATVLDVVKKADSLDDTLSVTTVDSQYGAYITTVNGESEKTFKGWDGWSYLVNDADPGVGVSFCKVANADSIVLYYGDPFGAGMQYPKADTSKLSEGKISFTSTDTAYDENWNPTTVVNTVKDYTLVWGYGNGKTVNITPDENGVCTIDSKYLTSGSHSVQIERTAANGCPTVLRFAPDYANSNAFFAFLEKIVNFFKTIIEKIVAIIKGA